jgi:hypothetical protein
VVNKFECMHVCWKVGGWVLGDMSACRLCMEEYGRFEKCANRLGCSGILADGHTRL